MDPSLMLLPVGSPLRIISYDSKAPESLFTYSCFTPTVQQVDGGLDAIGLFE